MNQDIIVPNEIILYVLIICIDVCEWNDKLRIIQYQNQNQNLRHQDQQVQHYQIQTVGPLLHQNHII